jgi:hypothetical protein
MTSLEIEVLESLRERFPERTIEELVKCLPTIVVTSSVYHDDEWEVTVPQDWMPWLKQPPVREHAPYTSADF